MSGEPNKEEHLPCVIMDGINVTEIARRRARHKKQVKAINEILEDMRRRHYWL